VGGCVANEWQWVNEWQWLGGSGCIVLGLSWGAF
jgi:hypothetical protein